MHAQVLNVNENVLYFTFEFQHIYTPYAPDVRVQPKKKKLSAVALTTHHGLMHLELS